jgi:hypothetical protein
VLQVLQHRLAVDAADRLDHRTSNRLAVRDDRQGFHRRAAEPRRPLRIERALHRPGHLGTRRQLQLVPVALQHDAAPTKLLGEHGRSVLDHTRCTAEQLAGFGDVDRTVQREAHGLERRGHILGLSVGGLRWDDGASEDVEHHHLAVAVEGVTHWRSQ